MADRLPAVPAATTCRPAAAGLPAFPPPDDVASFGGPEFGRLDLFAAIEKVPKSSTLAVSYVVSGSEARALPNKPYTLRNLVMPYLDEAGLVGKIVADAVLPRTIFVWTLPATLTLEHFGRDAGADPAVQAALRAMAGALVAEIDLEAFLESIRSTLALPAEGPVVRRLEPYGEIFRDLDQARALGELVKIPNSLNRKLAAFEEALQITQVQVPDPPPVLTSPYERWEPTSGRSRERIQYHEQTTYAVRPAVRAASKLVESAAVRARIPAALEDPAGHATGVLVLEADAVEAFAPLRALLAPGLRLTYVPPSGAPADQPPLAGVPQSCPLPDGFFAPWEPVGDGLANAGWAPGTRAALRAACVDLTNATGGEPLAILPVDRDGVLGFVGTSDAALAYLFEIPADDSPLPFHESAAAESEEHGYSGGRMWTVNLEAYRREVLGELLGAIHPHHVDPIRTVSTQLIQLGRDLEALVNPVMSEAEALGCPSDLLAAIIAPLTAARAALAQATVPRLQRADRTGAIVVAALADSAAQLGAPEPLQRENPLSSGQARGPRRAAAGPTPDSSGDDDA
jgi:hypothetical protein